MASSRRDFFKLLGAGAGTALVAGISTADKASAARIKPMTMTKSEGKAMLYDSEKCVGCRACQNGCKNWNDLPAEEEYHGIAYDNPKNLSARTWTIIKAREYTFNGEPSLMLSRYQCMHCTEASCEFVCFTGAISHQGAAVVIDQEWCVGCGYCVQACPYGVPHREHGFNAGPARKCTFCVDRQEEGLAPACVEACPAGALVYGDRNDLLDYGKSRVQELKAEGYEKANLYGENELGGLHALYVLTESPSVFNLPETPPVAKRNLGTGWVTGLITAIFLAVIPAFLLFRKKNKPAQAGDERGER
jgi:formate dehydrogenase iron-sulfur subunit